MSYVAEWAENMCFAAVGCAVIYFLLPRGNISKTAKTVCGLFLIWVMFMLPVNLLRQGRDEPAFDYERGAEYSLPEAAQSYVGEQAEYTVKKILDENGAEYSDVKVECNIEENGVINISSIEITTGGNVQTVANIIKRETGIDPVVKTE